MKDDKNLISNNGSVDEELLRSFFADSVRMHVADRGFSSRVMQRVYEEMPARSRFWYNVWTIVGMAVCVVAFFVNDGVQVVRSCLGNVAACLTSLANENIPRLSLESLLPQTNTMSTTVLTIVLSVWVLSCVALYDFWESQKRI